MGNVPQRAQDRPFPPGISSAPCEGILATDRPQLRFQQRVLAVAERELQLGFAVVQHGWQTSLNAREKVQNSFM